MIYTVLNGLIGIVVLISGGRLEPHEYDLKEYWTWKGPARPPWFVRAIQKRREHRGSRLDDENVEDDESRIAVRESHRASSKNELPMAVLKDRMERGDTEAGNHWRRETV